MRFITNVLRCRSGLETVTAVLMLLLMFALMTGLIATFDYYTQSTRIQTSSRQERAQEQVMLIEQTVQDDIIQSVVIENTGTIEVQIRALYKTADGATVFICDPSVDARFAHVETNIAPGKSLSLAIDCLSISSTSKILAATERGIVTINNIAPPPTQQPRLPPNTHKYTYGLLEILWEEFKCNRFDANFNPGGTWEPGWIVQTDSKYVAWRVTITNIGPKPIILNSLSSFTTISDDNSDMRSWYLYSEPTTDPQETILPVDVPMVVTFVWSASGSNNYKSIYSQSTVANVFLSFFGVFQDPTNSPYSQTVPFEAAITVV